MMQLLRNPKNVKMVSLFIAAIFVLGCFALSLTQSGFGKGAAGSYAESAIGVVNFQMLGSQSPAMQKAQVTFREEVAKAEKEYTEKIATMNEAEKAKLYQETTEKLQKRQQELVEPVLAEIKTASQKVADKKGLAIVVDKSAVAFGGCEITDEVMKELKK